MAKKFNLGEYLRAGENGDTVSTVDTREQIEYIPLELIDPDPENFYSLDGIEELAENIELVGLQQPIRVRSGEKGHVTVVSGHRRRAACMLIRDGGSPMFDQGVPCIREHGDVSAEMRELRLIYANSSTRVLSSAEISKQAQRVEDLLYKLKEQGVEFPGRMREHVAAAVQASSSRIGRLKVIREKLNPRFLEEFDAGRLGETNAYLLAKEPPEVQEQFLERHVAESAATVTAEQLEATIEAIKRMEAGDDGASRTPPPTRDAEDAPEDGGRFVNRPYESEAALIKDEKSAADGLKRYLEEREKEDKEFWTLMQQATDSLLYSSFYSGAGASRKGNIDELRIDLRDSSVWTEKEHWSATGKGLAIGPGEKITRTWTEVYDALAAICITRYREQLTRKPEAVPTVGTTPQSAAPAAPLSGEPSWQTGEPTEYGYYAAQLEFFGKPLASPRVLWFDEGVWYNAVGDDIRQHQLDRQIRVVGWWPLPKKDV